MNEELFNQFKELLYNINNAFYNNYNSTINIYFELDYMILQVDALNGYHHWCIKIDDFNILINGDIFKLYEKELIKNAIERNK
jgi:hypothetical protein